MIRMQSKLVTRVENKLAIIFISSAKCHLYLSIKRNCKHHIMYFYSSPHLFIFTHGDDRDLN